MKKLLVLSGVLVISAALVACGTSLEVDAKKQNKQENIQKSDSNQAQQDSQNAIEEQEKNPFNILHVQPKTQYDINISDDVLTIKDGNATKVKRYKTSLQEGMIVVKKNESLIFNVTNSLKEETSLHWHGLDIPNDQDGPSRMLKAGDKSTLEFQVSQVGTYWYHPHMRPILPQLNAGLYAPFIVKDEEDEKYAADYVIQLDDWALSPSGEISDEFTTGDMEIMGNVETVNGKSGEEIYPVEIKQGEIIKMRLINSSTAQYHTLKLNKHELRVTHMDGHKLVDPQTVKSVTLAPGERVDVEIKGAFSQGTFYMENERNLGIRIPVNYTGVGVEMQSPFVPAESRKFPNIDAQAVDMEFVLNSRTKAGKMGLSMAEMMKTENIEWTINNKSFPETDEIQLKTGQVYKFRFTNNDTMMMHGMAHPIHIHGEHFQVLSLNGSPPKTEMWKDTISVEPGEYVEIAIRFDNPGVWMLHCHIIDHEDNGMLTVLNVE